MSRFNVAPGEFLHIYNRGVAKNLIFLNDRDRKRFLFLMLLLQIPETIKNVDRAFKNFVNNPEGYIKEFDSAGLRKRQVELIAFCLMPNHFHLVLKEIKEDGISKYMQRLQNAYTKYINIKYDKSGHLLQSRFKSVLVEDNDQLLYLSSYIHKNPNEVLNDKYKYTEYFWSSYQDYVSENRWGDFLKPQIITDQFTKNDYKDFVKTSVAKEKDL